MTQEEPKEDKLFESVEQMNKIAQDLVRRKTELSQTKQKFVVFEYDEDNDPIGEVVGFIEGSNYIMVKVYDGKQVSLNDDLYDTPPQRTWVGLTDEEIQECYNEAYKIVQGRRLENAFYKTIEAKLKERNT